MDFFLIVLISCYATARGWVFPNRFSKYLIKWDFLVKRFPINTEPDRKSFNVAGTLYKNTDLFVEPWFLEFYDLRIIPIDTGLVLKVERNYSLINLFKSVLIPWENLEVVKMNGLLNDGFDNYGLFDIYQVYDNDKLMGNFTVEEKNSNDLIEYIKLQEYELKINNI